ncbi:arrestin 3b, retinal (X-arrestin) isoform X1 [Pimephales promelas]|uniref:arrestin 3b, retinal (X-arrestin) isoform X1 n=1 Tax=Pimephales promelas TaxID=90988 RepID=UPI00195576FD|nr:arrestin 3b, retinal (X-arrestin) isoform X1 [Pimephales promelas]
MAKVFKKTSGNGSLCLYLGKRDFVDHVESVDSVDGVLKIDPSDLNGRKVWVQLACAFRYGKDDLDVIGVSFRKDIWIKRIQMYPFEGTKPPNTPMQEALLKKAGDQGHPFTFDVNLNLCVCLSIEKNNQGRPSFVSLPVLSQIPIHLPCSVSLQPAPEDAGKPCGVDYEVKAYIANEADSIDEKVEKKDTCRLIIRKIQYAPNEITAGPKADLNKQFMTADKPIHLEASMEKELYYHGDPIPIKVKVNNETSKVVKKVKISIYQITDVLLYSADKYHKCVLNEEFGDQINANSTFEKEYSVTPLLANNKEKRGLALDGKLKDEDTNLASSTILQPDMDKQIQGVIVSYKIKVTLVMGGGLLGSLTLSDITVELPLVLMSPKPAEVTDINLE